MAGFLAQAVRGGLRAGRALAPQVRSGRRRRPEGGRPPAAGGPLPRRPHRPPPEPRLGLALWTSIQRDEDGRRAARGRAGRPVRAPAGPDARPPPPRPPPAGAAASGRTPSARPGGGGEDGEAVFNEDGAGLGLFTAVGPGPALVPHFPLVSHSRPPPPSPPLPCPAPPPAPGGRTCNGTAVRPRAPARGEARGADGARTIALARWRSGRRSRRRWPCGAWRPRARRRTWWRRRSRGSSSSSGRSSRRARGSSSRW